MFKDSFKPVIKIVNYNSEYVSSKSWQSVYLVKFSLLGLKVQKTNSEAYATHGGP